MERKHVEGQARKHCETYSYYGSLAPRALLSEFVCSIWSHDKQLFCFANYVYITCSIFVYMFSTTTVSTCSASTDYDLIIVCFIGRNVASIMYGLLYMPRLNVQYNSNALVWRLPKFPVFQLPRCLRHQSLLYLLLMPIAYCICVCLIFLCQLRSYNSIAIYGKNS